jgi:hypothetical protein
MTYRISSEDVAPNLFSFVVIFHFTAPKANIGFDVLNLWVNSLTAHITWVTSATL